MVVLRYRPKGKGPPPCPSSSQLAFTDDRTSEYVWGSSLFGQATQSVLPRLIAETYDRRLVGKDVAPRVGMTVVHTLKPTYGAGKVSVANNNPLFVFIMTQRKSTQTLPQYTRPSLCVCL
jgi:hypothetical protein